MRTTNPSYIVGLKWRLLLLSDAIKTYIMNTLPPRYSGMNDKQQALFPSKLNQIHSKRALLLHTVRIICFFWLWFLVLLFNMLSFRFFAQASLVHKEFGQLLEKSLSNFQINKSTLLITGSGSRKQTSFHTVPSGCRITIPPRHRTLTRSQAFSITNPYLTEAHSTYITEFTTSHILHFKNLPKRDRKNFLKSWIVSNTSPSKQASGEHERAPCI